MPTTPTLVARAMTPSESREAALHGQRALTPILSGAISGGIVGIAWIVGIVYWLYKRHRRARRAKAAGFASYREFLDPPKLKHPFIIPPDPAVIKGQVAPGQKIVLDKKHKDTDGKDEDEDEDELKHARTVPMTDAEERELEGRLPEDAEAGGAVGYGSTVNLRAMEDSESAPSRMVHRASAPVRVPSKHSLKSTRSLERDEKRDTYPPPSTVDS
ncbi:hypothetical protein LXA43DRAFT_899114 [Ganoderma leucocontextum]|nr:hypothetical protein LXA43DRAFT_899114 [Ganoderma leucocontextum]